VPDFLPVLSFFSTVGTVTMGGRKLRGKISKKKNNQWKGAECFSSNYIPSEKKWRRGKGRAVGEDARGRLEVREAGKPKGDAEALEENVSLTKEGYAVGTDPNLEKVIRKMPNWCCRCRKTLS